MYDVMIIGAGLAGTLSALELSKKYRVLLIEAGNEVIPTVSSSYNECYKLHTGMHYIGDEKTAEQCLQKAIEFARKFPDYIAGGANLFSPWRRGRHYVMANSMVSLDDAQAIAHHLQRVYANLVHENPDNEVFGKPEDFIRFLDKQDYSHIADSIPYFDKDGVESQTSVAFGIETAESQIDIDALKIHLQQQVNENPNIHFMPSCWVTNVAHCADQFGYAVTGHKTDGSQEEFRATTLVNCSWQNIEKLDRKVGAYVPDENRVVRVKASILVELPEPLRQLNTCIFSSGPYCSITVLPNGTAILTSERITNVGFYNSNSNNLPYELQKQLLSELELGHEKGQQLAQQILVDCASYMQPETQRLFMQSDIKKIHVGFVKLMNISEQYDQNAIHEKDSVIHARQLDGVEHKGLGYVSNSGMKMTYTAGNAEKVSALIDEDFKMIESLTTLIDLTREQLSTKLKIKHAKIIEPLLNITYRERMRELLLSDPRHETLAYHAATLASEISDYLYKKQSTTLAIKNGFFSRPSEPDQTDEGIRIKPD